MQRQCNGNSINSAGLHVVLTFSNDNINSTRMKAIISELEIGSLVYVSVHEGLGVPQELGVHERLQI
jgi:hypothetical protein